jgi:WD40 repeat protein
MAFDTTSVHTIDEASRRRFEGDWKAGRAGRIEDYLPPENHPHYLPTLEELVLIELEFTWGEERRPVADDAATLRGAPSGGKPRVEDYLARFPRLNQPDVIGRLLKQEVRVRRRQGQAVPIEECRARFPDHDLTEQGFSVPEARDVGRELPRIPGYEILGELGRGGMGVVYKARQLGLNRLVALKMVRAGAHAGPEELLRFATEARAVAHLQHPQIVQIFEVNRHEGQPFFIMELLEGGSLKARLDGKPLPPRLAAEMMEGLAEAVEFAHRRGIVHRDLKPANVLLAADGTPKITDFGLAKHSQGGSDLTQTGAVLGTPSYMAPEQAAGTSGLIGPPCDVYALGAILYEMLTGLPPFQAASALDTLEQVRSQEVVPPRRLQPKVPRDLETICLKCLRKGASHRYASAAHLAKDLGRFLSSQPIRARRIGTFGRLARWCRRQPALAGTIAVAVLLIITVAGVGFWNVVQERNHYRRAQQAAEQNLYRALVGEARALIQARPTDWRGKAMSNLRQAAELEVADRDRSELRELAIQCLGSSYRALRLHGTWSGHTESVRSVAVSPNGRLVVSASMDGTARLWELPGGRALAVLGRGGGAIMSVAFHPGGRHIAAGSLDGRVRVWDIAPVLKCLGRKSQGQPTTTASEGGARVAWQHDLGKAAKVLAVLFTPDGLWLGAGCADGSVRLFGGGGGWDGAPRATHLLQGHTGPVYCLAFLMKGEVLASGGADKIIRYWDMVTRRVTAARAVLNVPTSMSASEDGEWLAWADHETHGFAVRILRKDIEYRQGHLHSEFVSQAVIGGKYSIFTAAGDGSLKCWRLDTRANRYEEMGVAQAASGWALCLAATADERWLVAGYQDGSLRLWDLADPPERTYIHDNSQNAVFLGSRRRLVDSDRVHDFTHSYSPDGKTYVPTGTHALALDAAGRHVALGSGQGTIRVWDREQRREVASWNGHSEHVSALAFSPDGKRLASAAGDGKARLWSWQTGKKERDLAANIGPVHALSWRRDGGFLAASGEGGAVVWDLDKGTDRRFESSTRQWSSSVAFGPDILALGGGDGRVIIRDFPSGKIRHALAAHQSGVAALAISPDERQLVSAAGDVVRFWSLESGREESSLRSQTQTAWIAFPDKGPYLVIGSRFAAAVVWDLRTKSAVAQLYGMHDMCGQFTPDGSAILLGTASGTVRLCTMATVERDLKEARGKAETPLRGPVRIDPMTIVVPRGHLDNVYGVAASGDGRWFATASHDRTVKLWDAHALQLVRTFEHRDIFWCVAFSADSKYLAGGSREIKVWEVATGRELGNLEGHRALVRGVAFHPSRPLLASCASDGSVRLWDLEAARLSPQKGGRNVLLHQFKRPGVHNLAFHPDGHWLAVAWDDPSLALWDFTKVPEEPTPPARFLKGHTTPAQSVGFSADGRYLASGSDQGTMILWDGTTFDRITALRASTLQIRGISFSRDGALLAGAAYAAPTVVWDLVALRRTLGKMNLDW